MNFFPYTVIAQLWVTLSQLLVNQFSMLFKWNWPIIVGDPWLCYDCTSPATLHPHGKLFLDGRSEFCQGELYYSIFPWVDGSFNFGSWRIDCSVQFLCYLRQMLVVKEKKGCSPSNDRKCFLSSKSLYVWAVLCAYLFFFRWSYCFFSF